MTNPPHSSDAPVPRLGATVYLVGAPGRQGVVRQIRPAPTATGQPDCLVYFGPGDEHWYPASALRTVDESPEVNFVGTREFLRDLTLTKVKSQLTDTLFSVHASRTTLEPYQFRPVLLFLQSPQRRLILADEVGLGKTIEAGLILSEMRARQDVRRVLVVCPAGLREKWQRELRQRFDEDFDLVDSGTLRQKLAQFRNSTGTSSFRCIVSLETVRSQAVVRDIEESNVDFDLVIVDEAHHLRNPATLQHHAGEVIADRASALLFLTATPIQTRSENLYQLLHLLDAAQIDSMQTFDLLQEPNRYINGAAGALRRDRPSQTLFADALKVLTNVERCTMRDRFIGDPLYRSVVARLSDSPNPSYSDVATIQRDLRKLNTLSGIVTRTTKRDVKGGAPRSPTVIRVPLSEEEHTFYDAVLDFARAEYTAASSTRRTPPGFALVQRERQAASCIAAARDYLSAWMGGRRDVSLGVEDRVDELQDEESSRPSQNTSQGNAAGRLRTALAGLGTRDTKFEMFREAIGNVRTETPEAKVVVFSTFKRTLDYLERTLQATGAVSGAALFRMDGDVRLQDRPSLVERFAQSDGFSVMLLSEVGAEGLDFQFSDTLFNYDLPWNPMRVEQRIGRLDRYGQQAKKIRIYSFVLQDTIEDRILSKLYERINIFKESIGDLAEILGAEVEQIERSVFSGSLTPEQEEQVAKQFMLRIEHEKQTLEQFYRDRESLIAQERIANEEARELIEAKRYVTPAELRCLVETWLTEAYPGSILKPNTNNNGTFSLRPSRQLTQHLDQNLWNMAGSADAKKRLMAGLIAQLPLPVTFDGEIAKQPARIRLINFLNFRHPLTQMALQHHKGRPLSSAWTRLGRLRVESPDPDLSGVYWFFLYLFRGEAQEPQRTLVPVVLDVRGHPISQIEDNLLAYIANAGERLDQPDESKSQESQETASWQEVEATAHSRFVELRTRFERDLTGRNAALTDSRVASLKQTYKARIARYEAWLQEAQDSAIRRMREGQIRNAHGELRSRIDALEARRNVVVGGQMEMAGRLEIVYVANGQTPLSVP